MNMINRFVRSFGIAVTSLVPVSVLSPLSSFIAPVFSLPHPSSRRTAGALEDSNIQLLWKKANDIPDKNWFLNLRGGNGVGDDDSELVSTNNVNCYGDSNNHASDEATKTNNAYIYRTVQVQIIHRHGDRTPITPLKNEEFWSQQLVPEDLLERVAMGTKILRHTHSDDKNSKNGSSDSGKNRLEVHAAAGRGPFGKLTKLGLLGMIQVGTSLKEELEESSHWSENTSTSSCSKVTSTAAGTDGSRSGNEIRRGIKFKPSDIKVYSTDFARTIQSVQGLLVGFFPEGFSSDENDPIIDIDCRDTTSWMIPDPQPRQTEEQEMLERKLAQQPHVLEREESMRPLAIRCTQSLLPLLGEGAFDVSFGVKEKQDDGIIDKEQHPTLPWIQLTEITKCLSVRDMLPDSITADDQETLSAYTAWKWFQSLRSSRLAYLSMHRFTETIVSTMRRREQEPPLILYSGHDSSLIGLLCALHLEQPSVWPEYGAVLKIELLEKKKMQLEGVEMTSADGDGSDVNYALRFFLNGELLRSMWYDKPREEIAMEEFISLVSTVGNEVEIE